MEQKAYKDANDGTSKPQFQSEELKKSNEPSQSNKYNEGTAEKNLKQIEDNESARSSQYMSEISFHGSQGNGNLAGLDMLWDEIDKLRNKFNDYVHCEDFDEITENVDDLNNKLQQISKQGGFKIDFGEKMDDDFSPSGEQSPFATKSEKDSIIQNKEQDKGKSCL